MSNLEAFRKINKLTQAQAALYFGCTQGFISQIERGVRPLPVEFYEKALADNSKLGADALKKEEAKIITNPNVKLVPMVSQYAYAGYLAGFSNETYVDSLPTIPFIVDNGNHSGQYICFEVKGDSMNDGTEDSILEGDRLLCRELKKELWRNKLHYNKYDFVIVHRVEGVLIKRIIEHDTEMCRLKLHSLNDFYDDFVVDLNDVAQIFNVIEINRPRRR